ncbi:hypothetical protein SDC9_185103 [bioreactor metagenome]|uniref:Uncharacterized protein n=1 Tax=bioreactor metagenome TaxID=1076179 RepID=A0A645HQE1_9ZZZZ
MFGQPTQRMLEDWQIRGAILRKLSRAQEGCFSAIFASHGCDLLIIGRDNSASHALGLNACGDAIRNERIAGKVADVLARNALRAAARRNDGQNFGFLYHAVQPPSTIRFEPVI